MVQPVGCTIFMDTLHQYHFYSNAEKMAIATSLV